MTTKLKSIRYETLKKEVTDGKVTFEKVGHALAEIRDSKLYLEEYGTFEECLQKEWGWGRARGYQLIEHAKVIKSLPPEMSSALDISTRATQALAKVEPEKRASIIDKLTSQKKKVTEQSVKEEISKAPIKKVKKEKVLDRTGLEVPVETLELWNHGSNGHLPRVQHIELTVHEMRTYLVLVKKNMEAKQEGNDPLFREIDYSDDIAKLNLLITDVECAIPFAVCWVCNGKRPKTCDTCKGRGFVSEFLYKTCCPEEIRNLRK